MNTVLMKSMTGYGIAREQSEDSFIEVSVRSVNGRFLESRIHLPREFVSIEPEIKKLVSQNFGRGTVDVFVLRKNQGQGQFEVSANMNLAKEWVKGFKELGKALKKPAKFDLFQLARMPEVLSIQESKKSLEQDGKKIIEVLKKALKSNDGERKREGGSLQGELIKRLEELKSLVNQMESLRAEANQYLEERFKSKLRAREKEISIDPQRLAQETVILLEKADIDEELTRLREHFKNYEALLQSKEAEGKKLDFYTQELLREVNTIGSKSQVAKLTSTVVLAKTLIEKLREQVQNIE